MTTSSGTSPRRPLISCGSDITEHRTDEGKLYLCAIKDVYSNRIVGYPYHPILCRSPRLQSEFTAQFSTAGRVACDYLRRA
jgi:transposase InsO family protein